MTYPRAIDISAGNALIVTDLHGNGQVYNHIRDTFLKLYQAGKVNQLIICGDLIHSTGHEAEDASLPMLLDVMHLQQQLGRDTVIMLMGNHEMPHVYSVGLSKGQTIYTPRFERTLAQLDENPNASYTRADVMAFIKSLPFVVRTKAGVLITHAGATPAIRSIADAEQLLNFDHDQLIQQATDWMQAYELDALKHHKQYIQQVHEMLAVDSVNDPRFLDMLRGQLLSANSGQFEFLWDVLFTTNEKETSLQAYKRILQANLKALSIDAPSAQTVLVAGHIGVNGGHKIVAQHQLRLASHAHAYPKDAGQVLILNCETPVLKASDLVPHLKPTLA